MTTRRNFLKLLGLASVAPMALNLESALAAVPEPSIEKITNYVEAQKQIVSESVHLLDVQSISVEYEQEYFETSVRTCSRVEFKHISNPLIDLHVDSFQVISIIVDHPFSARHVFTGKIIGTVRCFQGYGDLMLDTTTMHLTEDVVVNNPERRFQQG